MEVFNEFYFSMVNFFNSSFCFGNDFNGCGEIDWELFQFFF